MGLNHPQTIHPLPPRQSVERLSSTKPVPSAKKGWGPLVYSIFSIHHVFFRGVALKTFQCLFFCLVPFKFSFDFF